MNRSRRTNACSTSGGYSLIELMIAITILGVVLAGVFYSFGVQNEKYVIVDQVTEAQHNLRGIAEMVERDIRRSGYMIPGPAAVCAHDNDDKPDLLFVSDSEGVRTIDELEQNAPELLAGDLGIPVVGLTSTTITVTGGATPQLKIDDGANVGLVEKGGVILIDRNDGESRVVCAEITTIAGDTLTVDFGPSAYATSIGNSDVVAIPAVVYKIQPPATSQDSSQMTRNGLVLAYDVEDLQAVFYFDANSDGNQDTATEIFGTANAAGAYPPATGALFDMSTIREVQVSVITVTRDDLPNTTGGTHNISQGQKVANRNANMAAPDRRTRRVHTANIRLRNLG
jgi:prepilin-type N-terminal cleavage/methylation domain-containing protein